MANKNTRNRRFPVGAAIVAHAAVNASDPFAAKRMALHISKGYETAKHVTETAERLGDAHTKRAKRIGVADWISPSALMALHTVRNGLTAALKKRPARKPLRRNVRGLAAAA